MTLYSILPGLPSQGATARDFGIRRGSEGFVVRFAKRDGSSWIGNFGGGSGRGMSSIMELGREPDLLIVTDGAGYIVNPEKNEVTSLSGHFLSAHVDSKRDLVVLNDLGLRFWAIDREGFVAWKSRRISWDGFRSVLGSENSITGEAYAPWGPPHEWKAFVLDLNTGAHTGGSYDSSTDPTPNQSTDPTLSSGTAGAGHLPRQT